MPSKLKLITQMYEQSLHDITKSPQDWISFLKSATWNFGYNFSDKVCIYVQKPNARACATMEDWNKKAKRWINPNAKGIALMKEKNGKVGLDYVFDVSDTHQYNKKEYNLWEVKLKYENDIIEALEDKFGILEVKNSLFDAIYSAACIAVDDNIQDYLLDLTKYSQNSFLEELDEFNIENRLRTLLNNSVTFMMLERCNINPLDYFIDDDFRYIVDFNTYDTIIRLGNATSDIAEVGITEIKRTVQNLQKQEKNKNYTIDKNNHVRYSKNINERSDDYGNNIYQTRRLPNSRFNVREERQSNTTWQIRNNEIGTSKEKRQSIISGIINEGSVNRASTADSRASNNEDRANSWRISQTGTDNRGVESNRPSEMDRSNEQHSQPSRGNSDDGANLQLELININLPTKNQQMDFIKQAEDEKSSVFSFPQEIIDKALQAGSHFEEGKYRIYSQFEKSLSSEENIKFLKHEYGIGGTNSVVDGTGIGENHNAKGIELYKGFADNAPKLLLSWNKIEKRIKELIKLDRYLNSKEKEQYTEWLEKQEQEEQLNETKKMLVAKPENYEEIVEEYEYRIGDTIYIGADEYEILSIIDDRVRLYDVKYPLFNTDMDFSEFDRKVKENPANDHLKVKNRKDEPEINNIDTLERKENQNTDPGTSIENMNTPNENEETSSSNRDKQTLEQRLHKFVNDYDIYDVPEVSVEQVKEDISNVNSINETIKYFDEILKQENVQDEFTQELSNFILELNELKRKLQVQEEKQEIKPNFEQEKTKIRDYNIHPELKFEERNQYKITNEDLGVGTPKEKYKRNIQAIKILQKCEEENRFATKEEQEVLSNYVGWGGLAEAFNPENSSWSNEYNELRELLSEREYDEAKASTLTAFYTPPVVIKNIYRAIENMGFKQGNILEPSCGIGNFIGMLPDELQDSKVYGVELDSITGRIARQLYQKSTIAVEGYENTNLPDSFFDVAVGNVPFGDFKVSDKKYDKNKFLIHDYFFAKTLDKVRPGGIVAFITSKGTMDKENPSVRKYIAQRADLIGAIRLPNNTFSKNAGTKVTSDIIFLQKRANITDLEPEWVHLDTDENGITMNKYFVDNPDMILGNMEMVSTRFGMDSTCVPNEDESLSTSLLYAINNIHANITENEFDDIEQIEEDNSIPADYNVRNFSYTVVNGNVYYRVNSKMQLQSLPLTFINRIKGLIEIRDCVRNLIKLQTEDYPDKDIIIEQSKLNSLYDKFTKQYGLINSKANNNVFREDSSYYLLCSLEIINENGELIRKADMFNKRTIRPHKEVTKVDTSNEALVVSMSEKAKVDIEYMQSITGKSKEEIVDELKGSIFKIPSANAEDEVFVTSDEYLSGNIREKLKIAEIAMESNPEYEVNVQALKKALPKDLSASEINVKLGATWLPPKDIKDFIFELLETPNYIRWDIKVHYSDFTSEWNIEGKNYDRSNIKAHSTYGTSRINAYKIIEDTLNLKDVRIYDTITDSEGKKTRILNKQQTAIAQAKQEQIKMAFDNWIWKNPERRARLVELYNEKFNSIRPREYDGSHLSFYGMNPEITLRSHQVNAIARILFGGNALLAHEVGAGKTFEMVAGAMESKRLGLCNKSLFVVPNHIIEQFASEFLRIISKCKCISCN